MSIKRDMTKKARYIIENDNGDYIAAVVSLEEAALIQRYLTGAGMPEADATRALAIMARIDAQASAKGAKTKGPEAADKGVN